MNQALIAYLYSDTKPDDEQTKKLINFLKAKYGDVRLAFKSDEHIKNGFILKINNDIYDWTKEGRIRQFKNYISSITPGSQLIPILRSAIGDWRMHIIPEQVGTVISVGDSIAMVSGLGDAQYGEILLFENGVSGMVSDLKTDCIGCILFDDGYDVNQGDAVYRTGKKAGVPVGEAFIGRVVNPLGVPIDDKGEILSSLYSSIETPAPQIIDRQPVDTPLETGILAIDSMFPIGRGQRELIIGDRQTGKTTIAIDTILNQKGKNVFCVYVAIGQKAGSVASIVKTLRNAGAMDYTCVVVSAASDAPSLQYIAPYAGTAIAEYFMNQGKDALIVYDDLSKHAVAYRTISLLLGRSPGREAYPGDVFYLHSRLLERSARLSDRNGGGSLTALPIVETQAGDISAYIPTNVISITDGQIFLESDLFFNGQRPAVNVGISVSRVGGAAQSKAVKKACSSLRLDLAQYSELESFTRFSGELDDITKTQLRHGKCLMNLLKQRQHSPINRHRQVIMLILSLGNITERIPYKNTADFLNTVFEKIENEHSEICAAIDNDGRLTDEYADIIKSAGEETAAVMTNG
ncbi:MAG: F0F1 ATP synthase subunit alpha [Clostridiales bacterium]|nr:F0F1 ATP synthase subunit alpha [Clostridiales bacterium]